METTLSKQEEWIAERLGKFTSSEIWRLMKSGKKRDELFGTGALTYIDEKIAEIITGEAKEHVSSKSLEWGKAHEYDAMLEFQNNFVIDVEYFGGDNPSFFPFNSFSGCSPDGLTHDSIVEIKCPFVSSNHISNLKAAKSNHSNDWMLKEREEYFYQMQFNMLCCNKDSGYFVSYDPRAIDIRHMIAVLVIKKDESVHEDIKHRLNEACKIVSDSLKLID